MEDYTNLRPVLCWESCQVIKVLPSDLKNLITPLQKKALLQPRKNSGLPTHPYINRATPRAKSFRSSCYLSVVNDGMLHWSECQLGVVGIVIRMR